MNPGRSGNLSARVDGGFLVTPSGRAYDTLHPNDLVFVSSAGEFDPGARPSSEWRLHRDVYARRADAGAIVRGSLVGG